MIYFESSKEVELIKKNILHFSMRTEFLCMTRCLVSGDNHVMKSDNPDDSLLLLEVSSA